MISVPDADLLLKQHARPGPAEVVPLAGAAGRVLREDVRTDRDLPPFDRVAMDGIALAHAALRGGATRFRVAALQAAGDPPLRLSDPAACIEIMTGAALPEGCDTVVPYEAIELTDGVGWVRNAAEVQAGQNVHARGSDRRAGGLILEAGARLRPTHVAALASVGKAEVRVGARPRVALLTTGDELVPVGGLVLPHQIRRSNGPALRAALGAHGYADVPLAHAPDDEAILRRRLADALATADVVVLSGGVSAGRFDLVPSLLAGLGVREVFHRVRQKPGKPLWFGTADDGPAVFGLPGNPVSALVCLYRYALPYLGRLEGAQPPPPPHARLTRLPTRKNDFTHFVAVRREGPDAHPVPSNGSGDFLSLVPSDGFAEVAPTVEAPASVPVHAWSVY